MKLNNDVITLFNLFNKSGHKLYIIGGAVRDYLLNKDIEDYGYWMPGSGLKVKCSSCKEETYGGKTKFCPHCGIEMKEKNDVLARLC